MKLLLNKLWPSKETEFANLLIKLDSIDVNNVMVGNTFKVSLIHKKVSQYTVIPFVKEIETTYILYDYTMLTKNLVPLILQENLELMLLASVTCKIDVYEDKVVHTIVVG